jgi:methionine-rich copper-binding protein CopC
MTPWPSRRSVAAVAFATFSLFVLLVPTVAFGHAELATMTPADKSTVPIPDAIVATFTENLDASGSNLVLVDQTGTVIARGGKVDATNKKQLTLDLTGAPLVEATYTVRWTSKSADDGDIARGTTTFLTMAGPSVLPTASPNPSPSAEASSSASPSVAASIAPSPSPSPSGGAGTPASSTSDALIPILAVLVVIALLGLWLLRGRSRRVG